MTAVEMQTYDDSQKYDICAPENEWLLPQIRGKGSLGDFILKLKDKAAQAGAPLYVSGLSSTPTLSYNGEEIYFVASFSHDPESMEPSYSSYTLKPMYYKKPWVQETLRELGVDFVQPGRLNCADLFAEVLGQNVDLNVLAVKYPEENRVGLFNRLRGAVGSHLGNVLRFTNAPTDNSGPELEFVNMEARAKYLANEETLMEEIRSGLILVKNELGL